MYKVFFDLGIKVYESEGDTLLEAFNGLNIENPKVLKSVLTIEKEGKKIQKVFNMKLTKLFARNPITRSVWAKLLDKAL